MNILYLSCHSILEYDELRLFEEIGFDYFSLNGSYENPKRPVDEKRPALNGKYHEHLSSVARVHGRENLHEEQIEWADVIIVMHIPDWIEKNWEKIKHKRVIWRTIGQSVAGIEERLKPYRAEGMEIVRYSPLEENVPGFIGQDAVIRFYKDPAEFKGWNGETEEVMTVAQSMKQRREYCGYDIFHESTKGLNVKLYGPNNENAEEDAGMLDYEGLKKKMRDNRVFFFTGTHPASYTLGYIEASMTGIPIVSIGHENGNSKIFGQKTFEVPSLIQNGKTGFVSDSPVELRKYCEMLLNDHSLAKTISQNTRKQAIELFGMKTIKEQWYQYLTNKGNK